MLEFGLPDISTRLHGVPKLVEGPRFDLTHAFTRYAIALGQHVERRPFVAIPSFHHDLQLTPLQQASLTVSPYGRCTNDAYVGAADWRWRSADGDWSIVGQVVGTVLENGPVRPVADGTRIHPGDVGWGAYGEVRKEGGKHWVGGGFADVESRAFTIEDLGYNQRADQISTVADLERRDLDP